MKIANKIIIIISLFLCGGCSKYWYKPYGKVFNLGPKKGSPGFKLGWEHGCISGLGSQYGGAIYMTFYTWTKDVQIAKSAQTPQDIEDIRNRYPDELKDVNWNNPGEVLKNFQDYKTVFWSAHSYCHGMIPGNLQNAAMTPPITGQTRFVPGGDNLNSIYKIDGRGYPGWNNW
jgi:hypothetical protein